MNNTAATTTQTQTIVLPTIKHADFNAIMARYDRYAAAYNEQVNEIRANGDRTLQTLKSAHRVAFADLISQARAQMIKYNTMFADAPESTEFDINGGYTVNTNNVRIKSRTGKDASTVWRNVSRLIEVGIITNKVNHGRVRNYELTIAPEFLVVSAYLGSLSGVCIAETVPIIEEVMIAKCNVKQYVIKKFNNKIITRRTVVNNDEPLSNASTLKTNAALDSNNCQKDHNSRKGETTIGATLKNLSINAPKEDKKDTAAAATDKNQLSKEEKLTQKAAKVAILRQLYANWLIEYMLKRLFVNHNEYPAAIARAKQMAQAYFDGCEYERQFENRKRNLTWRVDAVANWLASSNFDFSNIHITNYIDVTNTTSGFTNTKAWFERERIYQQRRDKQAIRRSPNGKMLQTVMKLDNAIKNGTFSLQMYMAADAYVQNNIPNHYQEFLNLTEYIRMGRKCDHIIKI